MGKKYSPTIKDLYPHLSEEQLKEAEENFDGYLEIVWRIYRRLHSDPETYDRFKALTARSDRPYDEDSKVERDKKPNVL